MCLILLKTINHKTEAMKNVVLTLFSIVCLQYAAASPQHASTKGENQTLYEVNFESDGATDNILGAGLDGVYYAMGGVRDDGKRYAYPVAGNSGYKLLVDNDKVETFRVTWQRIYVSNGSYPVYMMETSEGYIVDAYRKTDVHGFALTTDVTSSNPYGEDSHMWRYDLTNKNTGGQIYLVADGDDIYFDVAYTKTDGLTYVAADCYYKGCQHPDMQYVPAEPATCKTDGHEEYWYCPDCAARNYSPYYSEPIGYNGQFNAPMTPSYGAVDHDHDGVCDDCGKNMPVYKSVTADAGIVAGGKYLLMTQADGKYYAAATDKEEFTDILPGMETTHDAAGDVSFENATSAMMIELRFAAGVTEWGNGIRYGFLTRFDGKPAMVSPESEFLLFDTYDVGEAKYGFYMGLNADASALIHSAYEPDKPLRAYATESGVIFTLKDLSADEAYTECPVRLYRLTDTGTVGTNTYDMTMTKSDTDYEAIEADDTSAEGGTNVTGVTDALTQEAVDDIVNTFANDNSVSGRNVNVNVSVGVVVVNYNENNSITFDLQPTAEVSVEGTSQSYTITDDSFDGQTAMTVILYTGGIEPKKVTHYKQDGTTEDFYSQYSDKVTADGEKAFSTLMDNSGNMYVQFTVTEFSRVRISTREISTSEPDVAVDAAATADVYNLQGIRIRRSATEADLRTLPAGLYIVGGRKLMVK